MSESAEAVAASLGGRRNVTIEMTNVTANYCLLDPEVYMEKGGCHVPVDPVLLPMSTGLGNFTKSSVRSTGAVGILSYVLNERTKGKQEKIVIMYSVPYDRNMYKNWFALGFYDLDTVIDEKLYKEMYYNKEQVKFVRAEATGSVLIYQGKNVDVFATMSPLGRSIMKVEIWDKLFECVPQGPY